MIARLEYRYLVKLGSGPHQRMPALAKGFGQPRDMRRPHLTATADDLDAMIDPARRRAGEGLGVKIKPRLE